MKFAYLRLLKTPSLVCISVLVSKFYKSIKLKAFSLYDGNKKCITVTHEFKIGFVCQR